MVNIKDLIGKECVVAFNHYRAGFFYYYVYNINKVPDGEVYMFNIPIEDTDGAEFLRDDKAIIFMRWIRKAIDNNELIKIK